MLSAARARRALPLSFEKMRGPGARPAASRGRPGTPRGFPRAHAPGANADGGARAVVAAGLCGGRGVGVRVWHEAWRVMLAYVLKW